MAMQEKRAVPVLRDLDLVIRAVDRPGEHFGLGRRDRARGEQTGNDGASGN